jgi:hypothetical protein
MGSGRFNVTRPDVPDCAAKAGRAPIADNARRKIINSTVTLDIVFMSPA